MLIHQFAYKSLNDKVKAVSLVSDRMNFAVFLEENLLNMILNRSNTMIIKKILFPCQDGRSVLRVEGVTVGFFTLFSMLCMLSVLLLSCEKAMISGYVVDSETDLPLGGVEVGVVGGSELNRKTNDHGIFEIDGIDFGKITLTFCKEGYFPVRYYRIISKENQMNGNLKVVMDPLNKAYNKELWAKNVARVFWEKYRLEEYGDLRVDFVCPDLERKNPEKARELYALLLNSFNTISTLKSPFKIVSLDPSIKNVMEEKLSIYFDKGGRLTFDHKFEIPLGKRVFPNSVLWIRLLPESRSRVLTLLDIYSIEKSTVIPLLSFSTYLQAGEFD